MSNKPNLPLRHYPTDQAFTEAIDMIGAERLGIQTGLMSRFPIFNKSAMKYFRFSENLVLAGSSGSGKSFLANMLRTDFTDFDDMIIPIGKNWSDDLLQHIQDNSEFFIKDNFIIRPAINKGFNGKVIFLDFCYEITPKSESLRTLSTITGYNYAYLLSSQGIKKDQLEGVEYDFDYNKISDEEFSFITAVKNEFIKRNNIIIFNKIGNNDQIYETVKSAYNKYKGYKIVVKLDHTLLTEKDTGMSDTDLQNKTIQTCIRMKNEFDALCIPIVQTNSNMEDDKRRLTPALHFPTKKDLYAGGQVYQGADLLYIMLMPAKFGITKYGERAMPTNNLIHLSGVKVRNSTDGSIWLGNDLGRGKISSLKWNGKAKKFDILTNKTK